MYLKKITYPDLQAFTAHAIAGYGSVEQLEEANKVAEFMMSRFRKKHLLDEQNNHAWIEVILSACLIHNLFYDGTLPSLFIARETLTPIARDYDLAPQVIMGVFQAVESQLGDDTPVESLVPQGNSPNDIFALSCWYVEELNGEKKMPQCQPVECEK